jgi:hypothetical protein
MWPPTWPPPNPYSEPPRRRDRLSSRQRKGQRAEFPTVTGTIATNVRRVTGPTPNTPGTLIAGGFGLAFVKPGDPFASIRWRIVESVKVSERVVSRRRSPQGLLLLLGLFPLRKKTTVIGSVSVRVVGGESQIFEAHGTNAYDLWDRLAPVCHERNLPCVGWCNE